MWVPFWERAVSRTKRNPPLDDITTTRIAANN
jgi:hypothetical protein